LKYKKITLSSIFVLPFCLKKRTSKNWLTNNTIVLKTFFLYLAYAITAASVIIWLFLTEIYFTASHSKGQNGNSTGLKQGVLQLYIIYSVILAVVVVLSILAIRYLRKKNIEPIE
jgi:hypothetical protein